MTKANLIQIIKDTSRIGKLGMLGVALGLILEIGSGIYLNSIKMPEYSLEYNKYSKISKQLSQPIMYNEIAPNIIERTTRLKAERDSLYCLDIVQENQRSEVKMLFKTNRATNCFIGGTILAMISAFPTAGGFTMARYLLKKKE